MRALFDANVLISYLLTRQREGAVRTIVESAIAGAFTLLLPTQVIVELRHRIATKPYLRNKIEPDDADTFVRVLTAVAELLLPMDAAFPKTSRDPKDDYLIAYTVVDLADYLVTRDRGLLVLRKVAGVQIVSPAEFAGLLQ